MKISLGWMAAALLAVGTATGVSSAQAIGKDLPDAYPQIFHINPSRSSATFAIPASGEAANGKPKPVTNGGFKLQKSDLRFKQVGKRMSGQIVLVSASEHSGDATRDNLIRSQVLQAKQFPTITFAPASYEGTISGTGISTIQVAGVLTLNGKPHPITVPVQLNSNGFELTATAKIVVPYTEWGLTDLGVAGLPGVTKLEMAIKLVGYVTPRD